MMFKKRSRFINTVLDPDATLPDVNQRFIDACQNGDYPTVMRILDGIPKFNIDLASNFGKSVLRLAIENEHLEVVQALLDKSDIQNLKEALLLAIYLDHTQIAEAIIRHPKYKKRKLQEMKRKLQSDLDSFWDQSRSDADDSQFSTDITPLMLASQFNRVHIVQILYENGDRISKPHPFHCECPNCANRLEFDSLRHTQSRLNSYKALASEAYISFASEDPILTAFVLGHELKLLSTKEKCFKRDYLQLAENLSNYVCNLLNFVRGEDELRKVLNKTGKESEETYSYRLKTNTIKKKNASLDQAEYEYESLDRLNLAIRFGEKLFVAHPNCQQKLDEIWYNAVRNYSNKFIKSNKIYGSLLIFFYFLFLPLSPILVTFLPRSKYSKFANEPFVKFLGHTVMFAVFIVLISISFFIREQTSTKISDFLSDYYTNYTTFLKANKQADYPFVDFYMRFDKPKRTDIVIIVFVVGNVITEIYLLSCLGLKNFLSSSKNLINSTMNLMYIFNFALNTYVNVCVTMNMNKLKDAAYWDDLILNSKNSTHLEDFDDAIYWLNADRFYWNIADPISIAEGFFAFANLLSVISIVYILPVNEALGPLQICLGKMIIDFVKFSFILIVIFLAFMVPLDNLLLYYQERKEFEIISNHTKGPLSVEENFSSPWSTVTTMIMTLFGIGNFNDTSFGDFESATITEILCFLIFNSYRFATIIFLLNMLIASMTQSYERIFEKSDTEWKFARSRLYMEYIREGNVIPAPFNILLIPVFILQGVGAIINYVRKKPKKTQQTDLPMSRRPNHQTKQMNGEAKKSERRYSIVNDELTYQKIVQRILFRYLLEKERENDKMSESDFSELKQDLQMIRFEMMNELKQSRDESYRLINHLNHGLLLLGEEVFKNSKLDLVNKYNNFRKQDINHHKLNDKEGRLKAQDGIESQSSSLETNSSSSSSENCTENGVISSSSLNSFDSLNLATNEVNGSSTASLNENKKPDSKGVTFNYDLDIIKEEDDNDLVKKL